MSDLGLHCLPMFHKKDAMLIWVKVLRRNDGCLQQCDHIEKTFFVVCEQLRNIFRNTISVKLFAKVTAGKQNLSLVGKELIVFFVFVGV